jgi:hypothetical protein
VLCCRSSMIINNSIQDRKSYFEATNNDDVQRITQKLEELGEYILWHNILDVLLAQFSSHVDLKVNFHLLPVATSILNSDVHDDVRANNIFVVMEV